MKPEISNLIDDFVLPSAFDTQEDFRGLLGNLLEDVVLPLLEQGGHVRTSGPPQLTLQNGAVDGIEDVG